MDQATHNKIVSFIWGIADDVLRDLFKRGKYPDVILPMCVIRRMDAVLEPTKNQVLETKKVLDAARITEQRAALCAAAGHAFYNTSKFTLRDLRSRGSQQQLLFDFEDYLNGFSPNVQNILDNFKFRNQLPTLSKADALGTLINKFLDPDIDLSPAGIDNHAMGTVFEELVRKFNEENNEEAGEHWTPRDAVRLMANLVFLPIETQIKSGTYLLYDCACGTGGMLTVAEETLTAIGNKHGQQPRSLLYGQEINPETYAVCKADMLLKGEGDSARIVGGAEWSTLSCDAFPGQAFDFMLANPPYGKSWKKDLEAMGGKDGLRDSRFRVLHRGEELSLLTRSSDGQMLFLANMASKMNSKSALGSRIAEVHNGSSLFTGDAGQGESNIRRWLIENDWLEAIVALPLNLFYNTGIATYIFAKVAAALQRRLADWGSDEDDGDDEDGGSKGLPEKKRKKLLDPRTWERDGRLIDVATRLRAAVGDGLFEDHNHFRERVDAALDKAGIRLAAADLKPILKAVSWRVETAPPVIARVHKPGKLNADPLHGLFEATVDGKPALVEYEPDTELRDTEQVPLLEDGGIEAFIRREVLPYTPRRLGQGRRHPNRLRNQLHPALLQAAAAAHAGRNQRRHPRDRKGSRRAARRPVDGGRRMTPAFDIRPFLHQDEGQHFDCDRLHIADRGELAADRGELAPDRGELAPDRGELTADRGELTADRGAAAHQSTGPAPMESAVRPSDGPGPVADGQGRPTGTSFSRDTDPRRTGLPQHRVADVPRIHREGSGMIADLKPYSEYKESGLPWLGRVPAHWSVTRIKTVLREKDCRSEDGAGTLLSLTRVSGLIPHRDMTDRIHSAKTLAGYKRYRVGEIVMNRMQAWSGMFGAGQIDGLVSPDYAVFEVLGRHSTKLVLERLKSPDLVGQFALESKGIGSGFNRLYTDRFGPIAISLPLPEEQAAIVRFLDWANRRLERAIRAKRKVIALLNEQKQAIIHRAVTRGLDPSVPLKPSGIPWLGDIPQHWEIRRIKQTTRILRGKFSHRPRNDASLYDGQYPFIQTGVVAQASKFITSHSQTLNEKGLAVSKLFPSGTLVMTIAANIGEVAILTFDACFPDSIVGFVPSTSADRDYLYMVFLCMKPEFLREAPVNTQGNLNVERIGTMGIPVPPLCEQIKIAKSVEAETAAFEESIGRLEREIDLLREYRTRLVADIVTGKLDVREAAARLPDEAPLDTNLDDLSEEIELADEEAIP
ncbi:MAG: N-6 DNA methylase [Xanthomonadales bacterium]|jgi:type I restriction enzyme M protein|nr:N-6 DNA methylase [Xanthomonadales bacterium]